MKEPYNKRIQLRAKTSDVEKLRDLSEFYVASKSYIVRYAIDKLYKSIFNEGACDCNNPACKN